MPLKEALTQDILDSLSEGVFTVDKDFRITFFNRAAEKITGFHRDEVKGKLCKYVCDSRSCAKNCPIAYVLETGEKIVNQRSQMSYCGGKTIDVKINSSVLYNGENDPVGAVISFRDMSEFEVIREELMKESEYYGIVGHSKGMREIFKLIEEISDSDASVLICGESGTGKEMIANAIQASSQRKDQPFIKVNCSIFPPHLLASELFGHVKGAFTGAIKDRLGRFEIADKGTIFLDEVVEMPVEMQLQLLRVLQEGTFERVGESIPRKVDVRVISATNQDVKEAMERGAFREDLYYRLNVIPFEVPPLRERSEDIPHLVKHFIKKFSMLYKKSIHDIEDEALDLLLRHPWPGNIRELENAIEYAFARTRSDDVLMASKLPPKIRQTELATSLRSFSHLPTQKEENLIRILQKHQWNRSKAAEELGIGRTTLWRKLKKINQDSQ